MISASEFLPCCQKYPLNPSYKPIAQCTLPTEILAITKATLEIWVALLLHYCVRTTGQEESRAMRRCSNCACRMLDIQGFQCMQSNGQHQSRQSIANYCGTDQLQAPRCFRPPVRPTGGAGLPRKRRPSWPNSVELLWSFTPPLTARQSCDAIFATSWPSYTTKRKNRSTLLRSCFVARLHIVHSLS
jgi:hypothetical protein